MNEHQRPSGRPADDGPPVKAPTHAERCRTLATQAQSATLSTHARHPEGYPYGSLVTIGWDREGSPLFLLSRLAEHAQNLAARSEASVLVAEPLGDRGDPLALARMTLVGPCKKVPSEDVAEVRAAFLAKNPSASYYVDFDDFAFYRLETLALRYIGGFGRMSWVPPVEYHGSAPDPLASAAAGILSHMNEDHAEALVIVARVLGGLGGASRATMTAVDRYGFEFTAITPEGPRAKRLAFDETADTTTAVREAIVAMVKRARAAGNPK
jgi:putative heme iron utilization protein